MAADQSDRLRELAAIFREHHDSGRWWVEANVDSLPEGWETSALGREIAQGT